MPSLCWNQRQDLYGCCNECAVSYTVRVQHTWVALYDGVHTVLQCTAGAMGC